MGVGHGFFPDVVAALEAVVRAPWHAGHSIGGLHLLQVAARRLAASSPEVGTGALELGEIRPHCCAAALRWGRDIEVTVFGGSQHWVDQKAAVDPALLPEGTMQPFATCFQLGG